MTQVVAEAAGLPIGWIAARGRASTARGTASTGRSRSTRPGPLVVQDEPPAGLGPAEVGTLIDSKPDSRDLMAGLVDAAVKGVVRIRETSPRGRLKQAEYA